MIVYPKSVLPNTVQFLPTGGPSGGPAFKLDTQGPVPSILAIAQPLPKLTDWDTSVEMIIDTSSLYVTANGYEGCGIRGRLLKRGEAEPYSIADNDLLSGPSSDWHTVRTGWHTITQRVSYGVSEQPDVEDIQFCVKGPVGSSVKIAQLSVINQYTKYYDTGVNGQSSHLSLTRRENQIRTFDTYTRYVNLIYGTTMKTNWDSYLDTVPVNIKQKETVSLSFNGIIGAVSDSDSDVPITLKASIKFRGPSGNETWRDIATIVSEEAVIEEAPVEGTVEFLAAHDYTQAEMVILFSTRFGRLHSASVSHSGMQFTITSTRAIL